ncbi:hypothetical protein [Nocardia sp. NPDC057440]|uniref:hypothetical protein n=1 Tax=Nocardia sp. NPDC057440 TaxID=3346134 RepID=UPI00366F00D6
MSDNNKTSVDVNSGVINPEQRLKKGDWLFSKNKEYKLGFNEHDQLVIIRTADNKQIGDPMGTADDGSTQLRFETEEGDGTETRLELHDDEDGENSRISSDRGNYQGPAGNDDWDDEDSTDPEGTHQYVLTDDGQLVGLNKRVDSNWNGLIDVKTNQNVIWARETPEEFAKRKAEDDAKKLADVEKAFLGRDELNIKTGADYKEFPVEIREPANASEPLKRAIYLTNLQLNWLVGQMGKKDQMGNPDPDQIMPKSLMSGSDKYWQDKDWQKSNYLDDNLSDETVKALSDHASGAANDGYSKAYLTITGLVTQYESSDIDFKTTNLKVDAMHLQTYQGMYNKVQDAHDTIWAQLKTGQDTYNEKTEKKTGTKWTEPGIQDVYEERGIYEVLRTVVKDCTELVFQYAKGVSELPWVVEAKKKAADKAAAEKEAADKAAAEKRAAEKKAAEKEAAEKRAAEKAAAEAARPAQQQQPIYTQQPPFQQQQPGQQQNTGAQPINFTSDDLASIKPVLNTGADTGTGTGTGVDTGTGKGTGGTSETPNIDSILAALKEPVSGSKSGNTGNVQAPATPPMDPTSMMGPLLASNLMTPRTTMPQHEDSGLSSRDRKEFEELKDEKRRNAQPGGPTAATPAVQTTPPGVTAPANAGTPPPVVAPGAPVDFPLPDQSTVHVPPSVAEVLQKQIQNPSLDAAGAYAGTAGENKGDWTPVDPNSPDMKSGDVASWTTKDGQQHYAMVVKNENGWFILDGSTLVSLANPGDPHSMPLTEKYGDFSGFFHPSGLDANTLPDPESAKPPPPVVSQTLPSGPPPVQPPKQI